MTGGAGSAIGNSGGTCTTGSCGGKGAGGGSGCGVGGAGESSTLKVSCSTSLTGGAGSSALVTLTLGRGASARKSIPGACAERGSCGWAFQPAATSDRPSRKTMPRNDREG